MASPLMTQSEPRTSRVIFSVRPSPSPITLLPSCRTKRPRPLPVNAPRISSVLPSGMKIPLLMFSQVSPAGTTTVSPSLNACLKAAIQSLLLYCLTETVLPLAARAMRDDSSGVAARTDRDETKVRRVIFFSIHPRRYNVCSRLAN